MGICLFWRNKLITYILIFFLYRTKEIIPMQIYPEENVQSNEIGDVGFEYHSS